MGNDQEIPGAQTPWPKINQLLPADERFKRQNSYVLAPKQIARLCALLYVLKEHSLSFKIQGKSDHCLNNLISDLTVSTRGLRKITLLNDRIVSVESGCEIKTLHSTLFASKQEIALEDSIAEKKNRSIGSVLLRGAHSGLVLGQLPIQQSILGAELVTFDGGKICLGSVLEGASTGPAIHKLLWGIQQLPAILTKIYFKTTSLPLHRLFLTWEFRDLKELQVVLRELQAFTNSWERLDYILAGDPHEKSFILAQISGFAEEMEAFKLNCPHYKQACETNKKIAIKQFFMQQGFYFFQLENQEEPYLVDPQDYLWCHTLPVIYWKVTKKELQQKTASFNLPIWKKKLWEAIT